MAQQLIAITPGAADSAPAGGAKINSNFTELYARGRVLLTGAVPILLPPSSFFANNGVMVIGQAPSAAATVSFSATSGAGVTMTFSAATLLGTAADVGRILTILDGGVYKYATITAQNSTTVATVTLTGTLSGTGPFPNNSLWLSGTPTTNTSAFSVPLAAVYPNLFVTLPANAIFAGSAAGTYFAQGQSTTVLTAFNNPLTLSGASPLIPSPPTPFVSTGPGAFAQTTGAPITQLLAPVAGLALGPNGRMRIFTQTTNNNSAGAKTSAVTYGGSQVMTNAPSTQLSNTQMHELMNRGVNNAQVSHAATNAGLGNAGSAAALLSVDSAILQNLAFTLQLAAATDFDQLDAFYVELFPG